MVYGGSWVGCDSCRVWFGKFGLAVVSVELLL